MKRRLFLALAALALFAAPASADQKIRVEDIEQRCGDPLGQGREIRGEGQLSTVRVVVLPATICCRMPALDAAISMPMRSGTGRFLNYQIKARLRDCCWPDDRRADRPPIPARPNLVGEIQVVAPLSAFPAIRPMADARLLLLLAPALIKVKEGVSVISTVLDVADNPKKLQLREIDAAQLPRSLGDVDAA